MGKKSSAGEKEQQKPGMQVRYDSMETHFASRFVVNATHEEVIVNFSPGPISDPQTNQQLLPINTRIAMTPHGAARLAQTLSSVLKNMHAAATLAKADDPGHPDSLN